MGGRTTCDTRVTGRRTTNRYVPVKCVCVCVCVCVVQYMHIFVVDSRCIYEGGRAASNQAIRFVCMVYGGRLTQQTHTHGYTPRHTYILTHRLKYFPMALSRFVCAIMYRIKQSHTHTQYVSSQPHTHTHTHTHKHALTNAHTHAHRWKSCAMALSKLCRAAYCAWGTLFVYTRRRSSRRTFSCSHHPTRPAYAM